MLGTILLIVLVLLLLGGVPNLGLHSYGWRPSGGAGVLLIHRHHPSPGREAVTGVRLVTRDGELVAEVEIPHRSPILPDVLRWSSRTFLRAGGLIGGGPTVYREGSMAVVLT